MTDCIELSELEKNGGMEVKWAEFPFKCWVEKNMDILDEPGFWAYYRHEIQARATTSYATKNRDPTDQERLVIQALKALPTNRFGNFPAVKHLPTVAAIKPFVQKNGYYKDSAKLHEVPEALGGLSPEFNAHLRRKDYQKLARTPKERIGLAEAFHRLISRRAGLSSSKKRLTSDRAEEYPPEGASKRGRVEANNYEDEDFAFDDEEELEL